MNIVRSVKELLGIPVQPWSEWRVQNWNNYTAFYLRRVGAEWPPRGRFQQEALMEPRRFWQRPKLVLFRTYAEAQAKADELNVGYVAREPDIEELPF